jgi:hypothetical protein
MNRSEGVMELLKRKGVTKTNFASADSRGVSGFEVRFHGKV